MLLISRSNKINAYQFSTLKGNPKLRNRRGESGERESVSFATYDLKASSTKSFFFQRERINSEQPVCFSSSSSSSCSCNLETNHTYLLERSWMFSQEAELWYFKCRVDIAATRKEGKKTHFAKEITTFSCSPYHTMQTQNVSYLTRKILWTLK